MIATLLLLGLLADTPIAGASPSPAPSSSPLKTIVTVHSSGFCTALRNGVAPVLLGLMRDDTLIALGRSAYETMNDEITRGGYLKSSFNEQGAAQVVTSPAVSTAFVQRQRELATMLERNDDTIDRILGDKTRFPDNLGGPDRVTLASIKERLATVVRDQRDIANLLSGEAETEAMDHLSSAGPSMASSGGGAGLGPLEAQEAAYDPSLKIQSMRSEGYNPFVDTIYAKLARAVGEGQQVLAGDERDASTMVVTSASACAHAQ